MTKTAAPTLSLRSVSHRFGRGPYILKGIDAAFVANGRSTAIHAPSGSGKTTLLGILGGLIAPSTGRVQRSNLDGRGTQTGCAWVFQSTNAFGRRSALENVAIVAMAAGEPSNAATEAALRGLASVGLSSVAHRPARHLSGGELQRVAIARALVARMPFILADEPSGQLDASTTAIVVDALFETLSSNGRHLIVVTHDTSIAARCDLVLTLSDGALRGA